MTADGPWGASGDGHRDAPAGPGLDRAAPRAPDLSGGPATADRIEVEWVGRAGRLFRLALVNAVLTLLTVGLYRFWARTRLRRWYWSGLRPGGLPLEYVGAPLEKLLGFLWAVAILAFYLGIVNLALVFGALAILADDVAAYVISFAGLVPVWFYASYRARRYRLARTRWMGIRFGQEPGAWSYALRAVGHWLVTILSLGLLWPRMTFGLEKFRIDRTRFGDRALYQGGRWQDLMRAWNPVIFCAIALIGAGAATVHDRAAAPLAVVAGLLLVAAAFRYRARAVAIMAAHKSAGGLRIDVTPSAWVLMAAHLGGNLAAALVALIPFAAAAAAVGARIAQEIGPGGEVTPEQVAAFITPGIVGAIFAAYLVSALLFGVLRHLLVLRPLWRHYARVTTLGGTRDLATVAQTEREELRQAEGFAEALDIGGAI
ncbi:MAG: DUF898 family protein [Paracoccaceae bacterium]